MNRGLLRVCIMVRNVRKVAGDVRESPANSWPTHSGVPDPCENRLPHSELLVWLRIRDVFPESATIVRRQMCAFPKIFDSSLVQVEGDVEGSEARRWRWGSLIPVT